MIDFLPTGSIIQLVTAFAAIGTSLLLWNFRKTIEVRFLILLEVFVFIWACSYALEFSAVTLEDKVFFSQLSYLGIAFIPVCYFFFTTSFSQKFNLVSKQSIIITLVIPIVTLLLVFTNNKHHLVWKEIALDSNNNMLLYEHGIWFWCFYIYTFILIAFGIYNLASSISTFTSYYRKQLRLLIIASLIPIAANLMYVFNLNPFPGFDWTTVSFVLTGLVIALGIFRYKIFELIPLAQEKLLDTMPDGVLMINANGIIEEANPALVKTFELSKKLTKHTKYNLAFKNYPAIIELLDSKEDKVLSFESKRNNQLHFYHIRMSIIYNQIGSFNGKLMVVSDVTSIRSAEKTLKQKNRQLKEQIKKNEKLIDDLDAYAHTLAHDLKNSLGLIYSSSDIIIESIDEQDMDTATEFSKIVKESATKTINVTNELLKMATAGHVDVETAPVEMQKIYETALEQIQETITEYNAKISVQGNWINARAYAPWTEEIWTNLLSNAMKYGGTPPLIQIGCELNGNNQVKYWIKDNGDGIPQNQQQNIFNKHTRLQPEKALGYGLGLSIVKRIVEKLNGTVGVESFGEKGAGALFYFILPAVKDKSLDNTH